MTSVDDSKSQWKGFLPPDSDGNAKIKSEFIISKKTHSKDLNENAAPIKEVLESEQPPLEVDAVVQENDTKPKKARGQNKKRPRPKREAEQNRLCPGLVKGTCLFGEKCKYIHNIDDYMKTKPKDVSGECYSYRTHGVCQFGFACRFGGDHIVKDADNGYVNKKAEQMPTSNPLPVCRNVLQKDIQIALRKRKYEFEESKAAVKQISLIQAKRKKQEDGKPAEVDARSETAVSANGDEARPANNTAPPSSDQGHEHGCLTGLDTDLIPLRSCEKKKIDFKGKTYLAPLTTCGNLPFRVLCKKLGADITCGEMTLATSLLQGNTAEWALLKRHPCEDIFGVQVCGAFPDTMSRCAELLNKTCEVDFIDINIGCPIDLIYKKGGGSALMQRANKLSDIVTCMNSVLDLPLTCKLRTGVETKKNTAHNILPMLRDCGVALATLHGRSREARYTRIADWQYIDQCAKLASPMPIFGNGDVLSYHDYYAALENTSVSGIMIARGALVKPWIFTEIKERRDWDISSHERLDVLRDFTNGGLVHWGSDTKGVETTRRFLLEWLSFLHRYIPVGILERVPQRINERPPYFVARNDLETLLASPNSNDWIKISEMLLGKVPDTFNFLPKHKANSYK